MYKTEMFVFAREWGSEYDPKRQLWKGLYDIAVWGQ